MKKRLVTSALPYVNNIPHLGNIIQVLSADVFARFCRMSGYETLYVCGTDEYGTATETKAREEKKTPRELCDHYNAIHTDIYRWFNIQFDHFGRTSTPQQTEIVQDIFRKVDAAGYITEHTIEQLYSEKSQMFLADRYVRGTCPHCAYHDARGDQCESCGKLLEPTELIDPKSMVDGTTPVLKKTDHLYINLPALKDRLEAWMKVASVKGKWSRNAIQMTNSWIRDGLKERAITRDLKWGIPVPKPGFENKVFYVWFDAPIGYISISAEHTSSWKDWWLKPDEVELFQFIGKDNIPFHTVIFPCTQLASGDNWTMLHHMSSTEFLNYEGGKFSKSKGVGVFGTDAKATGIPADVWRFYIFYNRPETSDYNFTWADFQAIVNKELIGNFGNLVNRTLSLWQRNYGTGLPEVDMRVVANQDFWSSVKAFQDKAFKYLDGADLRDGLRTACELSDFGNKLIADSEPWKLIKTDPVETKRILANLVYLVRDLAILMRPFIPESAQKLGAMLGLGADALIWSNLGKPGLIGDVREMQVPYILFGKIEDALIAEMHERFAGSQADRQARGTAPSVAEPQVPPKPVVDTRPPEERFTAGIDVRVARIVAIQKHPDAEKLYIETLDDGSGIQRTIVSGLVAHYQESELLNRNILVVVNLKPAKLRGVLSQGMLLAASMPQAGGGETVEVIFADHAHPGQRVMIDGSPASAGDGELTLLTIDQFFAVPLRTEDFKVKVGQSCLAVSGSVLLTKVVRMGEIG